MERLQKGVITISVFNVIDVDALATIIIEYLDDFSFLELAVSCADLEKTVLNYTHWKCRIRNMRHKQISIEEDFDNCNHFSTFLPNESLFSQRLTFLKHLKNRDAWCKSCFEPRFPASYGHIMGVNCVALNPSLLQHFEDGYIFENISERKSFLMGEPIFASAGNDGVILFWSDNDLDENSQGPMACLRKEGDHPITSIAWSKEKLISASYDGSITIWDVSGGSATFNLELNYKSYTHTDDRILTMATNSNMVMSGCRDGTLCLFDTREKDHPKITKQDFGDKCIYSVLFLEDGLCMTGNHDGYLSVHETIKWDTGTSLVFKQKVHSRPVMALAHLKCPHTSTTFIVSGCKGGDIAIHTLTTKINKCDELECHVTDIAMTLIGVVKEAHERGVRSISFCPYGNMLITSGNDSRIHIWDISSLHANFLGANKSKGTSEMSETVCKHVSTIGTHSAQVPQVVCYSDSLFSASIDNSILEHSLSI